MSNYLRPGTRRQLYELPRKAETKKERRQRIRKHRRERYTPTERRRLWRKRQWRTFKEIMGLLGYLLLILFFIVAIAAPTALVITAIYWLLTH